MRNNEYEGFVIVQPDADPTEYAAIYIVAGTAGDNYLAEPATIGRSDRLESKALPVVHFSIHEHDNYLLFASHSAAVPYILDLDRKTRAARNDSEGKPREADAPQEPTTAAVNDNDPMPSHVYLDTVVGGNKALREAVEAIRKARGELRASDLAKAIGVDTAKARYLVHTLAELGFGEIEPFHTLRMPDEFLGPGNTVRDIMDSIALG
ncbi:helix-turn-helix domain-containing protein [Agrobacterium fabrum]|uniref:helix-turn-helix domain-containing protein n=1 Tax=Agrobacterium fabrum TaxID=1176649 RepID=UPI002157C295|nr:helix-turn-helix domain-containing protein [Agrobacterium fabrum]MCR6722801.1 helix-turn-helix domain-containing protein [Agrobacterium fabrum]